MVTLLGIRKKAKASYMISDIDHYFFKKRNKNKDFTLISRDCIGRVVYHQLGLRFLSPTINLFLTPSDFNQFCLNLKGYLSSELVQDNGAKEDYPVGLLTANEQTVRVHFMHYASFEEAKTKWDERTARVNYENLYVLNSFAYPKEIAELSDKLIQDWNAIPYPKAILVDKPYGFDEEFVIKKDERCKEYAWLLYDPTSGKSWKRTFNDFDFISFLRRKQNGGH